MFLDPERLPVVRQMLLNAVPAEEWRKEHPESSHDPLSVAHLPDQVLEFYQALAQVRQFQTEDFRGILSTMGDRAVTIRLFDAPMHEFLPPDEELLAEMGELSMAGMSTWE